MDIKLERKTWCAFGYKETGKSSLVKTIAQVFGSECLYYDSQHEVPKDAGFHAYKPDDKHSVEELLSIAAALTMNKRYRMFIIDEADRFFPPKPKPLPKLIKDMNDSCRHPQFNMSIGYVARRPCSINTDLVEIADYIFCFNLGGKNDIKYLNDLATGLGDTVRNLEKYHFVVVPNIRKNYAVHRPIELDKIFVGSDTTMLQGGKY